MITIDYFAKWPKAYDFPNQEGLTLAEALVTNLF
jgi:hypothetical protein